MTDSSNTWNNRNLESSGRLQMDLSGMGLRGSWYINRVGKGGNFFSLDSAVDTLRRGEGVLYELRRLWCLSRQALHRSRKYVVPPTELLSLQEHDQTKNSIIAAIITLELLNHHFPVFAAFNNHQLLLTGHATFFPIVARLSLLYCYFSDKLLPISSGLQSFDRYASRCSVAIFRIKHSDKLRSISPGLRAGTAIPHTQLRLIRFLLHW